MIIDLSTKLGQLHVAHASATRLIQEWKEFKELWSLDVITKVHVNRKIEQYELYIKEIEERMKNTDPNEKVGLPNTSS